MINYRLIIIGICFLVCSITPISALEMGSVEYNNSTSYFTDNNVEDVDNLTSSELGGLYYTNNIHMPNDPPNNNITYIFVGAILTVLVIIGIYCLSQYLSASNTVTRVLERVAYLSVVRNSYVISDTGTSLKISMELQEKLTPQILGSLIEHLSNRVAPEQIAKELTNIPFPKIVDLLYQTGDPDYITQIAFQTAVADSILDAITEAVPALNKNIREIMNIEQQLINLNSCLNSEIPAEAAADMLSTTPEMIPVMLAKIDAQNPVKANLIKEELIRMGKYLPNWKLQLYPTWCYK